jgi:hypothetical protein
MADVQLDTQRSRVPKPKGAEAGSLVNERTELPYPGPVGTIHGGVDIPRSASQVYFGAEMVDDRYWHPVLAGVQPEVIEHQ